MRSDPSGMRGFYIDTEAEVWAGVVLAKDVRLQGVKGAHPHGPPGRGIDRGGGDVARGGLGLRP